VCPQARRVDLLAAAAIFLPPQYFEKQTDFAPTRLPAACRAVFYPLCRIINPPPESELFDVWQAHKRHTNKNIWWIEDDS